MQTPKASARRLRIAERDIRTRGSHRYAFRAGLVICALVCSGRVTLAAGPDVNGDGRIDEADLAIVTRCQGAPPSDPGCRDADIDRGGSIDRGDLGLVYSGLGQPVESPSQLASRIADELGKTNDPQAKWRGVLNLLRGAGIGVYAVADGKPLISGAERSLADFYLYDDEVPLLAVAAARNEPMGYEALITRMGFTGEAKLGTPAGLHSGLVSAAADALANSSERDSFLLLVFRELGLRASPAYDLAQNPPITHVSFSPLQVLLLELEIRLTLIGSSPPVANAPVNSSASVSDSFAYLGLHRSILPWPTDKGISWGVGRLLQALGMTPEKAVALAEGATRTFKRAAALLLAVVGTAHARVLAQLVEIRLDSPQNAVFEYGRNAYGVRFRVSVPKERWDELQLMRANRPLPFAMVQDAYDTARTFGPLLGLRLPSTYGDQKGVSVDIDYGGLEQHFEKTTCPQPCSPATDQDGGVGIEFVTKEQLFKGDPYKHQQQQGTLTAIVDVRETWGIATGLGFPIRAELGYTARWRVPGNATISVLGLSAAEASASDSTRWKDGYRFYRLYGNSSIKYAFIQDGTARIAETVEESGGTKTTYQFTGWLVSSFVGFGTGSTHLLLAQACGNNNGASKQEVDEVFSGGDSWTTPVELEVSESNQGSTITLRLDFNRFAFGSFAGTGAHEVEMKKSAKTIHAVCEIFASSSDESVAKVPIPFPSLNLVYPPGAKIRGVNVHHGTDELVWLPTPSGAPVTQRWSLVVAFEVNP